MPEPIPNFRDLGGLDTADGSRTRQGVLLRSAMPAADDLPPDGTPWPPSLVIDLRSPLESGPDHPLARPETDVRQLSLLEALRPDGMQGNDPETVERMRSGGLESLYLGMLEIAAAQLVEVADLVASSSGPTLVHCAAGKDRTGVVAALVLRTVGVPRDTVVDDYLLSTQSMDAIVRRLAGAPRLNDARPTPPSYLALPREAIEAVLDVWDGTDGGVEGWLDGAGADRDLPDRLRNTLLV